MTFLSELIYTGLSEADEKVFQDTFLELDELFWQMQMERKYKIKLDTFCKPVDELLEALDSQKARKELVSGCPETVIHGASRPQESF